MEKSDLPPPSEKNNIKLFSLHWFQTNWVGAALIGLGILTLCLQLNSAEADRSPEGLLGSLVFVIVGLWYIVQKHRCSDSR